MKLSKTGIGLLTRLYRSVLHKCFLINVGLFAAIGAMMSDAEAVVFEDYNNADNTTVLRLEYDNDGGNFRMYNKNGNTTGMMTNTTGKEGKLLLYNSTERLRVSLMGLDSGASLNLYNSSNVISSYLSSSGFQLNGSSAANGIIFSGTAYAAGYASNLATAGWVNNYYYNKSTIDAADYSKYFDVNSTGSAATATGNNAVAIGVDANASGSHGTALGTIANASGSVATALGHKTKATGSNTVAIGRESISSNGIALGSYSVSTADVVSVGHVATDENYEGNPYGSNLFRKIVNVADGENEHDAVTVGQLNNNYYTKYGVEGQKVANDNQNVLTTKNMGVIGDKSDTFVTMTEVLATKSRQASLSSGTLNIRSFNVEDKLLQNIANDDFVVETIIKEAI